MKLVSKATVSAEELNAIANILEHAHYSEDSIDPEALSMLFEIPFDASKEYVITIEEKSKD